MNVLADESVDRPVVERLRQGGHGVVSISESSPGVLDEEVLRQATSLGALLVTCDMDFGELVFRQSRGHCGVVLLRLSGLPNTTKAELVSEVFRDRSAELPGAFSVISRSLVRIRRVPQP